MLLAIMVIPAEPAPNPTLQEDRGCGSDSLVASLPQVICCAYSVWLIPGDLGEDIQQGMLKQSNYYRPRLGACYRLASLLAVMRIRKALPTLHGDKNMSVKSSLHEF
jgi:hypothetical protein